MPEHTVKSKYSNKELLVHIRKRSKLMFDADEQNRTEAMEDLRFINVPGEQWEENMKTERGKRPCLEFNKIRITAKRIINQMRANRPSAKIRGVEGGDKDTADIIEGLVRNIENVSDIETITDTAAEFQVGGGMGAWRIETDYTSDKSFHQDINIKGIENPFCLYCDPAAKDPMKRDAEDWLLTEKISKTEFEATYPDAKPVDFEGTDYDDDDEWEDEDEVRLGEYHWKEPMDREIWQLEDGKVIDASSDEAAIIGQNEDAIKNRRVVKSHRIMMAIVSGSAVLEGPTELAGSQHRFIVVYGENINIDGRNYWYGICRFAKDAQRSYNSSRTSIMETIAQAPQAKWWATVEQAEGHVEKWAEAHKKNFPFLLYNNDPKAPGPPTRMGGADIPIALIQESQMASEEINMVTGIFAADVGAANQAKSGRHEIARQQQGEIATFNYQDNMSKGRQRTAEILIDLIPHIYDAEREIRVLGSDGAEDYVKVNSFVLDKKGKQVKVHDLSQGQFDVTVTSGPNFSTQRQEASEIYQQLTQGNPQIFPLIGDLIFKSMDLPYAEDIAERLQTMLPPQIQQLMNKDTEIPPEVQMMMQQAQQAMQQVQQQMEMVKQAASETQVEKSEVEKLMANLKTEQARFEAKVAQELARIAEKDARLTIGKVQADSEGIVEQGKQVVAQEAQAFNVAFAEEIEASMMAIQDLVAAFNQHAVKTMDNIQIEKDKKPAIARIKLVKEGGQTFADPVYEDG